MIYRNEVRDARYVSRSALRELLAKSRPTSCVQTDGHSANASVVDAHGDVATSNNATSKDDSSNNVTIASVNSLSPDDVIVTPWFRLLCERDGGKLFEWWDNLDDISSFSDGLVHKWT